MERNGIEDHRISKRKISVESLQLISMGGKDNHV